MDKFNYENFVDTLRLSVSIQENPLYDDITKSAKERIKEILFNEYKDRDREAITSILIYFMDVIDKYENTSTDWINLQILKSKFKCLTYLAIHGFNKLAKDIVKDYDEEQEFLKSLGEE